MPVGPEGCNWSTYTAKKPVQIWTGFQTSVECDRKAISLLHHAVLH